MSAFPDFATLPFETTPVAPPPAAGEPWLTAEGIEVRPTYGPADAEGLDFAG